ncbi:C-type lectin domain family 4 member E [Monomorium pharaonis]|uniref:C-type lectin domain family 4 member E n=1 Tax=Monomorium pharaonis TaxID=307658 RepID=UPI00174682C8|nr:C-type lectin domain family 4 member E [Monomorium pharaonis]XP_036147756.1 C-type lectin domain family 4 member E [Monomorium pharaonis]
MLNFNLILFFFVLFAVYLAICDRCCLISRHELPQYDLIKTKSRSSQPIISRKVVPSLDECKKFAALKRALAFNFISARNRTGGQENSCQALQCPEDYNMTTLVPEANCRYYSMYPVLSPPANTTNTTVECVPKAGIFLFSSEGLNYTEARKFCQKRNSSLAHVISEERMEGLGKFVSQNISRFVGLSSESKERIWRNEFGESLSCFDYRAWGEGEPSHSRGCVALVNPSAKSSPPFWKVMPCHVSLPFICEISPLFQESSKRRHYGSHRRT